MSVGTHNDDLVFEFPEVHEDAVLELTFHRTLRIPDDSQKYKLPPSLGRFPLRNVDDLQAGAVPSHWSKRGGIVLPMWQSEAMWISFRAPKGYAFAVKIACGKINALTGEEWTEELNHDQQDYMVVPGQPWVDGFCVDKGTIRQFVAMPLGNGYTAEEQIMDKAEHGGIQVVAYPIKPEHYRPFSFRNWNLGNAPWNEPNPLSDMLGEVIGRPLPDPYIFGPDWGNDDVRFMASGTPQMSCSVTRGSASNIVGSQTVNAAADMGLGAGGKMEQEIYEAKRRPGDWSDKRSKCFVAIANSLNWQALTGQAPPTTPPTARDYHANGLPWYAHYDDAATLEGGPALKKLKSVKQVGEDKGETPLPENAGFDPSDSKTVKTGKTLPYSGAYALKEGAF